MKKRIKYANENIQMGKRVEDFLPSPEEIMMKEKSTRITINLREESLNFFKKEALRLGVPYQRLIRSIIDLYAQRHFA
ncbi:MAG: CopG family transcriptional regulator [Deltaproteobacteria bacterium]|nr:MAG: CopG family transcriptional regulator [Deltaproteobacteria bacterium]